MLLAPLGIVVGHRYAIAQQAIHIAVGGYQAHGLAVVCQLGQRRVHHWLRQVRVQPQGGGFEVLRQQHIALVFAARAIVQIRRVCGVALQHVKTTHMLQALQQRLFNLVFGDEIGHG